MEISRSYSLHDALTERSIPDLHQKLARVQEQTATGRRINRPSDDPHGAARVDALKALDEKHTQYQRNIEEARNWLRQSELGLSQLSDLLQDAREMATKATNPNYNADDLQEMGSKVQDLIDDVGQTLNTRHNSSGEYIFAGTDTTATPKAFEIDGSNTVNYNGNDTAPERRIGSDTLIPVSVDGQQILDVDNSGVDLVDRLENLRDALVTDDQTQIQNSIGELKAAHDHVVDLTSELGTHGRRMRVAEDQLQDARLTSQQRRSDLEDIDFAEAFSELQQLQTNYQASLKVTSTILNRSSLVDYL